MRHALFVSALLLGVFFFVAPSADAQDENERKKPKKVKSQGGYHFSWGRRADITQRYWPVHQHPYIRIR